MSYVIGIINREVACGDMVLKKRIMVDGAIALEGEEIDGLASTIVWQIFIVAMAFDVGVSPWRSLVYVWQICETEIDRHGKIQRATETMTKEACGISKKSINQECPGMVMKNIENKTQILG